MVEVRGIQPLNRFSGVECIVHQHLPFSLIYRRLYSSLELAVKDIVLSKLSDQENRSTVQNSFETYSSVMVKY